MKRAPVLFIGHGSPMNALADNSFTQTLHRLRDLYPNPKAILCISAHWMTEGSWSILRHVFPEAKIPVLQLSLHMEQPVSRRCS